MPDENIPGPPKIDFAEIIARRRAKAVQEDLDRPVALERAAKVRAEQKRLIDKEVEREIAKVVERAAREQTPKE